MELNGKDIKGERAKWNVFQHELDGRHSRVTRWTLKQIEDDVVELSQDQYRKLIDVIRAIGREKSELKRIKKASNEPVPDKPNG